MGALYVSEKEMFSLGLMNLLEWATHEEWRNVPLQHEHEQMFPEGSRAGSQTVALSDERGTGRDSSYATPFKNQHTHRDMSEQ